MAKTYFVLSILLLISIVNASPKVPENLSKIVRTAQGPVLGYKNKNLGIYSFYDIPYATAPTGKNKFKAPLPPPQWTTTFEAVNRQVTCPQLSRGRNTGPQSADCLVASVFTPDTNRTNLPVYVIIHGGAYQFGYGNSNGIREFVRSKNVVAVTYNYRVGLYGLLCLGTETVPGNAGMKDQVAALRWIKRNIASFGGNPEDITISGSSAGASSAELLMLAKSTEGLFNKVIVQSGAAVAHWSADPQPLERARRYARKLNFTHVDDIDALEEFYTTTPLDVLLSLEAVTTMRNDTMFFPCVERNFGEETFLEKAPVDIIKSRDYRKVPVLYGYCNKEGIMKVSGENVFEADGRNMNKDPVYHLPLDLQFETAEEELSVADTVKKFYFGNKLVGTDTVEAYIDMTSDTFFIYPMLRSVKLHLQAGHDQIYLFDYSFPTKHLLFENVTMFGATHTAQAKAVFDESDDEDTMTNLYRQMKANMRDLWYNFVSVGSPVGPTSRFPPWPPVNTTKRFPYMILDAPISLQHDLLTLTKRIQLWDEIYDKYYKTPGPPESSGSLQGLCKPAL